MLKNENHKFVKNHQPKIGGMLLVAKYPRWFLSILGNFAQGDYKLVLSIDYKLVKNFRHFRKSQLYGQIFVYILTIILVAFVLAYGYKSIKDFRDRAEKVCELKFKNDLSNSIKTISSDYGSVKRKDLQLCASYQQVCFVETYEKPNMPSGIDPIIKDSMLSNTGRNVFLVDDSAKESFYAGNLSVEPDVLCIKAIDNKISLRLEGRGDHTSLSQWA